jgi:hypothetical protein
MIRRLKSTRPRLALGRSPPDDRRSPREANGRVGGDGG